MEAGHPAQRGRRRRRACGGAVLIGLLLGAGACGRKGPPLPPLVRVPAAVTEIAARRLGDDVYVTFTVPSQNVDGSTPVFVDRVELRALVAAELPARALFLERSTVVAAIPVQAPEAAADPATRPAGAVAPGATVTIRDRLPARTPAPGPPVAGEGLAAAPATEYRYYLAVPASGRRTSGAGTVAVLPLSPPPPPPAEPTIAVRPRMGEHRADLELTWAPAAAGVTYNVYRVDAAPNVALDDGSGGAPATTPVPLNPQPIETASFSEAVAYEETRCYQLRSVRTEAGMPLESAPSGTRCETPVDTAPPSPPADVAALAGDGEITVVWTASPEPDVVGYLVLRGRAGDDTLAGITAAPVAGTRFVDRTVTPGVRYVYAVVAVDSRQPQGNRSPPSARDEATAR